MAIFKCKMCGGTLEISNNETVAVCEYCGTKQTLPKLSDDERSNLYDRANHFRRNNDFDKAMAIYEKILNEDKTDAEAYWSIVLCRYGIEYVEDPSSHKRVPTVNRAQYTSIFADEDYKSAIEYADGYQKDVYEAEAKAIDEIQKGILAISSKEDPFDIFICYKETDEQGKRTPDSVMAQDIYYQLTEQGYKVFFSRITLERKLGTEYEPYIFAALNSAKVMLVVGTKQSYFDAVWVKNEWSRFLNITKQEKNKVIIPCYRDMDAYDLPNELLIFQSLDMGKIGFVQDLIHGINKIVKAEQPNVTANKSVAVSGNANTDSLLERAFMFLEDGDWNSADEYCEKVLDIEPKCAEAYLGKLMAELKVSKREELKKCEQPFGDKNNYQKAIRFGDEKIIAELEEYVQFIIKQKRKFYEDNKRLIVNNAYSSVISAGGSHTVGLKSNGSVVTTKYTGDDYDGQCEISEWQDIVSISASWRHTVGLKSDGTVVATKYTGDYYEGQCDVDEWTDIVAISAGPSHTVGVKSNGTVLATKYKGDDYYGQCEVGDWTDIVMASAGTHHTVGVQSDGRVVATKYMPVEYGYNYLGQCEVANWTDIVAVAAGDDHTVGLKLDGTVVATGDNHSGQCNVSEWEDIIAISAGSNHTVGLKSDGTVVAIGFNKLRACETSEWKDIVTISAGDGYTVALKSNGTVVSTEYNGVYYNGQCEVGDLNNIYWPIEFESPEELLTFRKQQIEREKPKVDALFKEKERQKAVALEKERQEKARLVKEQSQNALRLKEQKERKEQYRKAGVCQYCGGSFKGLFSKICTKCGKKKDY